MTDPVVTIDGDVDGGFIVSFHDGDRFQAYGIMAESADAARAEGLRRFQPPVPVVEPDAAPASVTA